jgi:hypothetical protein
MKNSPGNPFFFNNNRNIELPFTVTVKSKKRDFQVTAEKIFRIAPKKRIVCSGKWNDKKIVMKFFLKSRKTNYYFAKELKGLKALMASGINTPEILFHGQVKNSEIKVIATKEIFPVSDMMSVWNSAENDSVYAGLEKQVIHEIAALHNAGLKQDDLHLGNFLLSDGKIFTIDGDGVDTHKIGQPLSKKLSLENLSILFAQFFPHLDTLAEKSLEYYADCRGWDPEPGLFTHLKPKIQKLRTIKLKKYLRKIFRECSEFIHKKDWNTQWSCDRKAFGFGLSKFIRDPDLFIEKGKILKKEETSTITRIDIETTVYVVKKYIIKSLSPFSEKCLKKTRARVSWRNAHLLKQLGDKLPHPVLFMEKRFGPFCSKAYFIVKYVPNLQKEDYSALFQRLENNKLNPEQGGYS